MAPWRMHSRLLTEFFPFFQREGGSFSLPLSRMILPVVVVQAFKLLVFRITQNSELNLFFHLYMQRVFYSQSIPVACGLVYVVLAPVDKTTQWQQSRHRQRCQPAGGRPRAPASAQVTIGTGTTALRPIIGWCSEAHRRRRSASQRHGHPKLCTAEYSAHRNTPQHAREPIPIAKSHVAPSTFDSQSDCFDIESWTRC